MTEDAASRGYEYEAKFKTPMTSGTSYHPTFADMAQRSVPVEMSTPDDIEDRKSDRFQVFVQALIDEHLGRITFALEQIQQSYADIQARLVRMEPLIEYAEQLVEQRNRITKWIPGKKS